MGKASRKAPLPPSATPKAQRRLLPIALGGAAIVVIAAVFVLTRSSGEDVAARQPEPSAAETSDRPALAAHPQKTFPPLPFRGYAPPRPPEVVTAAYKFAAEHPEVLSYIPCFCGCERSGHRSNEDCFVKSRAANGDVDGWEDHGMECAVCLEVAEQAMQMNASGASPREIRLAVERKWAPRFPTTKTPTPSAP